MDIWIWIVLAGIVISAIMTVRATNEEDAVNEKYIEEEGQVYMDRISKERQLKSEMN